jgi:sortase A
MTKYYYKKNKEVLRNAIRLLGLLLVIIGSSIALYIFFPLISWQIYFAPVFASDTIEAPIPKTTVINSSTIQTLISEASSNLVGDYTNARSWFPNFAPTLSQEPAVKSYNITIPEIGISDAVVSTVDDDLTKHLINFQGTAIPPQKGNAVIFGHSTLPQLFQKDNYKTIFANAYKLKVDDVIYIDLLGARYKYVIKSITVTDPTDTSVFEQTMNQSYITLITCTPPGTIWKRLIIKAALLQI